MKSDKELYSYKQPVWSGVVFIALFVIQQAIAFVWYPFNLVTPYWILYVMVVVAFMIKNVRKVEKYKDAFSFFIITAVCSFITIVNGDSIGICLTKALCPMIGLLGLFYLTSHRINLVVFDVLFVFTYLFFFYAYFFMDVSIRASFDGDLFGHSSSNTIPIVINVFWVLYYMIAKSYGRSTKKTMLLVLSAINLLLIVLQGSRIGVAVAALNCLLAFSDVAKLKRFYFPLLVGLAVYFFVFYGNLLEGVIDYENMQGLESYNEDARSLAQSAFFYKMSYGTALFGYPDSEYFYGLDRTFNAFLDFWGHYGIVPLIMLLYFIYIRIKRHKCFAVPLVALVPILLYSFFESLWGNTLWDILIFISLFYSHEKSFTFSGNETKTVS